jgi:AcrR family transcriptional regulator
MTMDEISLRALAQLEPEGLYASAPTWQQRKSAQTRIAILESAIDCLHESGYGRTTTQLIAERAGISRGAMLHHYATKQDLIAAVIDYTMYKRMIVVLDDVRALQDRERVDEMEGMRIAWRTRLEREFGAFVELAVAARNDPDLAELFLPRASRFDRIEKSEYLRAFPEWQSHPEAFALAMDWANAALCGLAINRDIWDEETQRDLVNLVGQTVSMLRRGELQDLDGRTG